MNKSSFNLFIKNNSIHNLNDIVTTMRVMASFVGGKHLTHRQIETALKTFSKQSADAIMKTRVNIGTFNAIMNENFGVNENAVEAYLKQRMEGESE